MKHWLLVQLPWEVHDLFFGLGQIHFIKRSSDRIVHLVEHESCDCDFAVSAFMDNVKLQIVVLTVDCVFWRCVPMQLPWLVIWFSSVLNELHKCLFLKWIFQILCVLDPVNIQLWPFWRFRHWKIEITRTALYLRDLNVDRGLSLTC